MESKVVIPTQGQKITVDANGKLQVPNHPIIPFIEGDGIGVDVTPAMLNVVNAAVEKAYKGERKIAWMRSIPARSRLMSMAKVPGCRPKPWISFVNTASLSRAR